MLEIRVVRAPDLNEWSTALQGGCEDAAPQIARAMLARAEACFERRVDPWGVPWPVPQRGSQATGALQGSLTAVPATTTPGVTTASVHSPLPYASVRQFGNQHAPATPFLPVRRGGAVDLPADQRAEIETITTAAIRARIAALPHAPASVGEWR